jgi:hypothetical protein
MVEATSALATEQVLSFINKFEEVARPKRNNM